MKDLIFEKNVVPVEGHRRSSLFQQFTCKYLNLLFALSSKGGLLPSIYDALHNAVFCFTQRRQDTQRRKGRFAFAPLRILASLREINSVHETNSLNFMTLRWTVSCIILNPNTHESSFLDLLDRCINI
jgi:hypothetical protein